MPSFITIFFQSAAAFGLLLSLGLCQEYQLGFLLRTSDPPGFARNFTGAHETLPADLKMCEKLCATGMWAMYTKPSFGDGKVDQTLVYPIQASRENDCTTVPVNNILSQIESIACLGGCAKDRMGFSYFNGAYFLRNVSRNATDDVGTYPKATTEADQIRSLAITIAQFVTPYIYMLCPTGTDPCYCHDHSLGLELMVPDVKLFPLEKPFGKLIDCIAATQTNSSLNYRCPTRFVPRANVTGCQ